MRTKIIVRVKDLILTSALACLLTSLNFLNDFIQYLHKLSNERICNMILFLVLDSAAILLFGIWIGINISEKNVSKPKSR
jgi:hypothetical protein